MRFQRSRDGTAFAPSGSMTALDRVAPTPRLLEIDGVNLAVSPERAWEFVRHADLGRSRLVHALFVIRTLPGRLAGRREEPLALRLDDLVSSLDRPGFQILVDDAPREVVVGAIGKVWHLDIPFVHVPTAEAFAAFSEPGFVKVAWAIRVSPHGESGSHVSFELRVDATDEASWEKFRAYFRLIGPASHLIRRSLLAALARDCGTPESQEQDRPLPGDELLPDAVAQVTHGITIAARPEAIWPWLVQMGCRRAGFYAIDALDNGGVPSAREVHPELQHIRVGDVVPAVPGEDAVFEVLRVDEDRTLVLGGLFDPEAGAQLPFAAPRPAHFWHATWAFVLEPLDEMTTRLHVRARVAFPESGRLHAAWTRLVHHFMETAQLRHLAARAEQRLPRDSFRDVAEGAAGAAVMAAALLTPSLRAARSHWGLDEAAAARAYPGDELVPAPRWSWTHGIEIDAPAGEVWPWVAQIGANRGGFYSYQWLENLAGCDLRNAETIHPEWAIHEGSALVLHPKMPPLHVALLSPGKYFVAHAPTDSAARASGEPWAEVSWLFFVEPMGDRRCRLVSRYRCACSDDMVTRLQLGPTLVEPIGFAMDRRMLMGVKTRAERASTRSATRSAGGNGAVGTEDTLHGG
jgi:hypothetical protein